MRTSFQAPWAQPVITGEDLARDAVEDFAKFFERKNKIEIRIEIDDVEYAVTRGIGKKAHIVISRGMANEVIHSPELLFFHLFILGHEIAHVIQLHNNCPWYEKEASRALEMWADFYGTKVMMCLVTFGKETNKIFRSFFPRPSFGKQLDAIGKAVGLLVTHVYCDGDSDRYPHILERVGCLQNGVHSFIRRELIAAPDGWQISVYIRMMASKPVREKMILFGDSHTDSADLVECGRQWHINTQGSEAAIAPGFRAPVDKHLHTSFVQSIEELEQRRKNHEVELIEAGILARSSSGELCLGPGPRVTEE